MRKEAEEKTTPSLFNARRCMYIDTYRYIYILCIAELGRKHSQPVRKSKLEGSPIEIGVSV